MAERDVDFYASLGDLMNGIASRDKLTPTLSTGEPVSFWATAGARRLGVCIVQMLNLSSAS